MGFLKKYSISTSYNEVRDITREIKRSCSRKQSSGRDMYCT